MDKIPSPAQSTANSNSSLKSDGDATGGSTISKSNDGLTSRRRREPSPDIANFSIHKSGINIKHEYESDAEEDEYKEAANIVIKVEKIDEQDTNENEEGEEREAANIVIKVEKIDEQDTNDAGGSGSSRNNDGSTPWRRYRDPSPDIVNYSFSKSGINIKSDSEEDEEKEAANIVIKVEKIDEQVTNDNNEDAGGGSSRNNDGSTSRRRRDPSPDIMDFSFPKKYESDEAEYDSDAEEDEEKEAANIVIKVEKKDQATNDNEVEKREAGTVIKEKKEQVANDNEVEKREAVTVIKEKKEQVANDNEVEKREAANIVIKVEKIDEQVTNDNDDAGGGGSSRNNDGLTSQRRRDPSPDIMDFSFQKFDEAEYESDSDAEEDEEKGADNIVIKVEKKDQVTNDNDNEVEKMEAATIIKEKKDQVTNDDDTEVVKRHAVTVIKEKIDQVTNDNDNEVEKRGSVTVIKVEKKDQVTNDSEVEKRESANIVIKVEKKEEVDEVVKLTSIKIGKSDDEEMDVDDDEDKPMEIDERERPPGAEVKEEESEEDDEQETRIEVETPKITTDFGKELNFVKLPNFLSVETRPFDKKTYEDEIEEEETLDEEGRARLKLKVENTIRWRERVNEANVLAKESNARFVRWSDGTMSLHLGSEIFNVYKQPLQGDHNHLFIQQGAGLEGQAVFRSKLTFRPHSTDSFTHRKMTMSLADRSNKTSSVKMIGIVGKDPESQREEKLKKEEISLRSSIRSENLKQRVREKGARELSSAYLDAARGSDDDEYSISKIKNEYKDKRGGRGLGQGGSRPAPASAGLNIYSSSEASEAEISNDDGSDLEIKNKQKGGKRFIKDSDSSSEGDAAEDDKDKDKEKEKEKERKISVSPPDPDLKKMI